MKHVKLLAVAGVAVLATGCAMARSPVTGYLYSDVSGSESAAAAGAAPKTGESCAQSILGMVGLGDASAQTAAKNGGISKIRTVDYHTKSIWVLYAETCTQVHGE